MFLLISENAVIPRVQYSSQYSVTICVLMRSFTPDVPACTEKNYNLHLSEGNVRAASYYLIFRHVTHTASKSCFVSSYAWAFH